MAKKIIKNKTSVDREIADLGIVISANNEIDLSDSFSFDQIARSEDLLTALSEGIDSFQVNDGTNDLSFADGIDYIRDYYQKLPFKDDKLYVRAESRPDVATTYFTCVGDSVNNIGDGNLMFWDFSNTDNDITAPSGYKRKRIDFTLMDRCWLKEGTIYFFNALKGSYIDFYLVAPAGVYGPDEVVFSHYVIHYFFQGDCPMGDELNTESCSEEIPAGMIFRLEITVPDTDTVSNGYVSLEIYRERTVIL